MVRGPWLANIGVFLVIPVYRDFSFRLHLICMQDVTGYTVFILTVPWYHFLVKILVRDFFRENKLQVSPRARSEGIWRSGGIVPLVRNLGSRQK